MAAGLGTRHLGERVGGLGEEEQRIKRIVLASSLNFLYAKVTLGAKRAGEVSGGL